MTTSPAPPSETALLFEKLLTQACCGEAWDMVVEQRVPISFNKNALLAACLEYGDNRTLKKMLSHPTFTPRIELERTNFVNLWVKKSSRPSSLKLCLSSPLFCQRISLSNWSLLLLHSHACAPSKKGLMVVEGLINHGSFVPAVDLLINKFPNLNFLSSLYQKMNQLQKQQVRGHLVDCVKKGMDIKKVYIAISCPTLPSLVESGCLSQEVAPFLEEKTPSLARKM